MALRPLMRIEEGRYLTACWRFEINGRDGRWMIAAIPRKDQNISAWLDDTDLTYVSFDRLHDALKTLDAHLTVEPLSMTPAATLQWKRVDERHLSHCGRFVITPSDKHGDPKGWHVVDQVLMNVTYTRTLRWAKAVAVRRVTSGHH